MNGKNFYDLLDVMPDATAEEIDAAYKRAKATYGESSVALYSLYSDDEKDVILEEINDAYATLSQEAKRDAYDAALSVASSEGSGSSAHSGPERAVPGKAYVPETEVRQLIPQVSLKNPPVVTDTQNPLIGEQYRVLYTKLEHLSLKNSYKCFAITSSVKGEGKTITSLNLGYVMANDFKKKVLIIECDLRRPTLMTYINVQSNSTGTVDVLSGNAEPMNSIIQIEETGLYIMPARRHQENSTKLLGSQRFSNLIKTLKYEFDYILLDSPPILPLADMGIISRVVDGLILVVRAGKTPKDIVTKATASLNNSNIIGTVLNGADMPMKNYYY
ncbi:MAG: polysaccharide biosynthesis tyrosine autokinase [Proteobacteria bacterium]|nr:polysaccharide biosynthesis tyrosine autokinase [Pseudomonadota bacterium]